MSDLTPSQIEEVFRLFDPDGDGLKLKELGTVMRSLGLNVSNELLDEFSKDFLQKSGGPGGTIASTYLSLAQFQSYVDKATKANIQGSDETNYIASCDLDGLKNGLNHYYYSNREVPTKKNLELIAEKQKNMVKISDLLHLLSKVGDNFTEEEGDDFLKDVKSNCKVENGKVDFEEVRRWVLS